MVVDELFRVLELYTWCEIRTSEGVDVYKGYAKDIPEEYMDRGIISIEPTISFYINDKQKIDNSFAIRIIVY